MYQFDGRVRYSEVDENGVLSITSLVNFFQDCPIFESEALGAGIEYLMKIHRAWILSSWQIVIDRMPKLGETVTVQTWPYGFDGFYGYRNLQLCDAAGNSLARANSVWVYFDTERMRPVRATEEEQQRYELREKLEMDYAPRKIRLPQAEAVMETYAPITVGHQHLDTNHHVNNGQYVVMAVPCLPEDFVCRQLRVEYRMQAHLGDVITPVRYKAGEGVCLIALETTEGKPYAVLEFSTD